MNRNLSLRNLIYVLVVFVFTIESCNKKLSGTSATTSSASTSSTATTSSTSTTIAVATDSSGTDSIYMLQSCAQGYFRDSIAFTGLPDSTKTYLASIYNGYNFLNAFVITDSAGAIGGYVVIFDFNGKPVGLLFNSSGGFIKVLEQRQGTDLNNDGWHHGGRFENRDGLGTDTISISLLPTSILSYMTDNYPQDTLLNAYFNSDSSYLIISEDNGLFATLFSFGGNFVKRIELQASTVTILAVLQSAVPSNVLSYLTTSYPGYVFDKAFTFSINDVLQGYIVVIDANNTKYAMRFDAAGNFLALATIW